MVRFLINNNTESIKKRTAGKKQIRIKQESPADPTEEKTMGTFKGFGLELEVHATQDGKPADGAVLGEYLDRQISQHGKIESDAGVGLVEFITHPTASIGAAVESLRFIENALRAFEVKLHHTVYRPAHFGPPQWSPKPRYKALIKASRRERPESWRLINEMRGLASAHLNMSGPGFDPLCEEGQLVMNALRNAGPHIAAFVHDELGYGYGHLSMWDFADKRRMPDWHRWHPDFVSFNAEFAGKPRFVGETDHGSGKWQPLPTGECSVYNPVDLGTYWDFARPKLIPGSKGRHYLEVRLLPSMELEQIEKYTTILWQICESIHSWHGQERGFEAVTREEVGPLFQTLHEQFGNIFPTKPLDEATWKGYLTR